MVTEAFSTCGTVELKGWCEFDSLLLGMRLEGLLQNRVGESRWDRTTEYTLSHRHTQFADPECYNSERGNDETAVISRE